MDRSSFKRQDLVKMKFMIWTAGINPRLDEELKLKANRLVVALAFFCLLALIPAERAEAQCYTCELVIFTDMTGMPIGFAEVCLAGFRMRSFKNCWLDSLGRCNTGGDFCRFA